VRPTSATELVWRKAVLRAELDFESSRIASEHAGGIVAGVRVRIWACGLQVLRPLVRLAVWRFIRSSAAGAVRRECATWAQARVATTIPVLVHGQRAVVQRVPRSASGCAALVRTDSDEMGFIQQSIDHRRVG
jgi:hypothetical protein